MSSCCCSPPESATIDNKTQCSLRITLRGDNYSMVATSTEANVDFGGKSVGVGGKVGYGQRSQASPESVVTVGPGKRKEIKFHAGQKRNYISIAALKSDGQTIVKEFDKNRVTKRGETIVIVMDDLSDAGISKTKHSSCYRFVCCAKDDWESSRLSEAARRNSQLVKLDPNIFKAATTTTQMSPIAQQSMDRRVAG